MDFQTPETTLANVPTVLRADGSADPATDPGLDAQLLRELMRAMVRTRIVDERLVLLQRQGRIGFHIGSLGEEATILGSIAALRPQDWIFPCYREFSALLWRGLPLSTYLDNMFGNEDDPVRGRQMPDHWTARALRIGSVSSPIGTQITQAVGFAMAARHKAEDVVTMAFFGDGATSSNDFHTGLNFAGVYRAPTVFLCRNNGWAISVPTAKQTASTSFADKGVAYGVRGVQCDGNDVLAVWRTVRDAVSRAAAGEGPQLVECITYRLSGHSTSDDPKVYRADDEVTAWRRADPIARLRRHLELKGLWTEDEEKAWAASCEAELKAAIEGAEKKAPPALSSMFDDVFAERPWHLEEQCAALLAGPRAPRGH